MQSFTLPSYNLTKLDKINRNFFWNKDSNSKSPNLIGWDNVCKPKDLGGFGSEKQKPLIKQCK